ncbi:hypothetical protein H0O03_01080 [Candidatus Micrarchaeota archaeon]|nr:hypothetical protein [Candidatus Micrarchaeota archaeon]
MPEERIVREYVLRRHGEKTATGELAPAGRQQGEAAGKQYGTLLKTVKTRAVVLRKTTNVGRTKEMSQAVAEGLRSTGAATVSANAREFPPFFGIKVKDAKKIGEVTKERGEDGLLKAFYAGEDVGAAETPEEIGQRHLKGIVELDEKLHTFNAKRSARGAILPDRHTIDITGHAPGIGSLAMLLGFKDVQRQPEKVGEDIRIQITSKGKAIAVFRYHQKDVTALFPHLRS